MVGIADPCTCEHLDRCPPTGARRLTPPLAAIFRDSDSPDGERAVVTEILTHYASGDGGLLADLMMDASPREFLTLFQLPSRTTPK